MTVWNSSHNVGGMVHVTGLAELQKALDQFPAAVERNIMRGALRAGASVIAEEARRLVPVNTGQLRESIRVSVRVSNGRIIASVKAGGRYKVYSRSKAIKGAAYRTAKPGGGFEYHAPFYAHFVEFGTASHAIAAKTGKGLFVNGQMIHSVNHPGARPKPFMRPAFHSKAQAAVEAMADYMRERIPREWKKLGGGHG